MKKFFNFLFSRIVVVGVLLVLQVAAMAAVFMAVNQYFTYFYIFCDIAAVICTVWLMNDDDRPPDYKIVWVMFILAVPIFGIVMFLLYGADKTTIRRRRKMKLFEDKPRRFCEQNEAIMARLYDEDRDVYRICKYIADRAAYPVYDNTGVTYFSLGEDKLSRLKWELESARRYIFLEYFIIEEGEVWNGILDILKRKASQGVDVRVLYDDFGCVSKLPYRYFEKLEKFGIKARAFSPFIPVMTSRLNNRDHRKICVIDGHTAFTGGVNLADEYANKVVRFGHWKDTAVMLSGDAAWSMTVMFLTMWQYTAGGDEDYERFRPDEFELLDKEQNDGFVQPYSDSPHDTENVSENIYMNIIERAKDYVYITTPYLILDDAMETSLKNAAKAGVDVRIITPHIPDKKLVFEATRASYMPLMKAGVKIYEYTPGFVHAKMFVSDDKLATVGTANLDYRSLFLHFECGALMYGSAAVSSVKADFLETFEKCHRCSIAEMKRRSPFGKALAFVMKIIAPLL